jgi:predicted DCC family thiol-disulfide oxidoreductase YuxK
MWGVGDNRPGRAWRRVQATVAAFDGRQRLGYLGWLALRGASWLPESIQRTAHRATAAQRAAADHTGHHLPGQAGP